MNDPRESHLTLFKCILHCVKGTLSFRLHIDTSHVHSLIAYSYEDWAGSLESRRSASVFCIYLGDNLVFIVLQATDYDFQICCCSWVSGYCRCCRWLLLDGLASSWPSCSSRLSYGCRMSQRDRSLHDSQSHPLSVHEAYWDWPSLRPWEGDIGTSLSSPCLVLSLVLVDIMTKGLQFNSSLTSGPVFMSMILPLRLRVGIRNCIVDL